ncbi:MAG TPA: FtsW/RodA/SpoVE family cell cycle protein [Clostridiales bacterium]|nr:FtsW/RodA/SpoVE family cell cycle protein [Clostridiales bacterium]
MQDALTTFFSQFEPVPWLCYLFPVLALGILIRCAVSLLTFRPEPEVWAWLTTPDGAHIPVTHWESLIGRGAGCDVQLGYPTVSRTHAVLTRYDDGSWTISDAHSKSGVFVNGKQTALSALRFGDVITMGGVNFTLIPLTKEQERIQAGTRTRAGHAVHQVPTLLLLTLFQLLTAIQLILGGCDPALELTAFGGLIGLEWALYLALRAFRRTGFEAETLAFFLCTMGLAVVSSSAPESLVKELLAIVAGVCAFLVVCWSLRDLERAKTVRYLAAVAGIGLLAFNLLFGVEKFGARNWIQLGGVSFQPSEFVKVCFIYVGASTLSRLMAKRNIVLFIAYSAVICACLALMKDFGTAIIFFVAFLVIAFLRSGNFATIALAIAATGFAGVLVLRFLPYARNRFEAWGHVWDYALTTGYSQTRSMMCIASGGLFGLGPGKGWLKYVAASDTDLVFAFVSEEWGLIMAVLMVACIVILACFVVRSAPAGRSCFYTIGACAAVTVMVTQTILNVFGMADFLPLTGVTFPFVSNGGSSMVCVWGLLAFIKAADTRQNASVAIRVPHGVTPLPEEPDAQEAAEEPAAEDPDAVWQRPAGKEACR